MRNKITMILIIVLVLFVVTGCGTNNNENTNGKEKNVEDKGNTSELNNNVKTTSKANINETIILDKNGIKITAKTISYDGWLGPEIKLLVENNSENNVMIQTRKFSINGIMIEPVFSVNVQAGKKANDAITISSSDLKAAKIETIKDIEFSFAVSDSNSWQSIFMEDGIKLETDAKDYVQKYNSDGTIVVDQNDVKIYVLKKEDKDSFWGADIYIYIENNSSQNITVQARDVSIDGFMIDPVFSADVTAGKKIYDTITFFESDLKDNGITDIKEIEMKFHIFNSDSWKTINDTDAKKISF